MTKIIVLLNALLFCCIVNAQNTDSLYADKAKPYLTLQNNLDIIAFDCGNRDFTTFIGLDINFSQMRISSYLQDEFGWTYKSDKYAGKTFTVRFVPKATSKNEFIEAKYFYTNRADILGYYKTEDNTYDLIDKVEITGTKGNIIELFLKYWCPIKTTLGAYKIGEIAFKEFYSDRVTLVGISANVSKIVIGKSNATMDYYKTFGVNAPKAPKSKS